MERSQSFIRTKNDTWGIDGIVPVLKSSIPIISAIGTSRDGKSTSLNLYANWLIKNNKTSYSTSWYNWLFKGKTDLMCAPFAPFLAMQTDEVVTNGIDYYIVPDECMLIDCQGMQLKDARYDHFLMLITYLMSNVIILTVRERLDLQVLNNCLAVFSFLSEIPDEFRRKDKPVLLIRIKDFQNLKQLRDDPHYLKKLVDKWLEKSNDQYDQIKEAFRNTFEIDVIATHHPIMNEDGEVDIHDKDFFEKNKTFLNYCIKLQELSTGKIAPDILNSEEKLIKLIDSLKENTKIDWKKLDLYHQITENELRKYVQDYLINCELSDKTLIDKMNGSNVAFNLYVERENSINIKNTFLFNDKFKDITKSVKEEVFNGIFGIFMKIVDDAKIKNIEMAEKIIKPHYDKYINQFKSVSFLSFCVNKITNYFDDNKKQFINELKKVDKHVYDKYMDIVNKEEIEIDSIQQHINNMNKEHSEEIEKLLQNYNISKTTRTYIYELLEKDINKRLYNTEFDELFTIVKTKVLDDIQKIYTDNDKTYKMDSDKQIISVTKQMKYDVLCDFDRNVDEIECNKYYIKKKQKLLTEMGFIKSCSELFNFNINHEIKFVGVKFDKYNFVTTEQFYNDSKLDSLKTHIENDLKINVYITPIELYDNVKYIKYSHSIVDNCDKKTVNSIIGTIDHIFKESIVKFIMQFCTIHNIQFSSFSSLEDEPE